MIGKSLIHLLLSQVDTTPHCEAIAGVMPPPGVRSQETLFALETEKNPCDSEDTRTAFFQRGGSFREGDEYSREKYPLPMYNGKLLGLSALERPDLGLLKGDEGATSTSAAAHAVLEFVFFLKSWWR